MRNSALVLFLLAVHPLRADGVREQFQIEVTTMLRTSAKTHNRAAEVAAGPEKVQSKSVGDERFSCSGEQRRSASSAVAEVANRVGMNDVAIDINTLADANGGHEVECAFCPALCAVIRSQDTVGQAQASGRAQVHFSFDDSVRPIRYRLRFSNDTTQTGASLKVTVSDSTANKALYSGPPPTESIDIVAGGGKRVTVGVEFMTNAEDRGGCCKMAQSLQGTLGVRLTRAPILAETLVTSEAIASSGKRRRIAGGEDTADFPEVGALLYEGELNCTATLISPSTAITAAHCVYARDAKEMMFVSGTSIFRPEKAVSVSDFVIPAEENFHYDDESLTDDIALVYLAEKQDKFLPLYIDRPDLAKFKDDQRPVDYVGFGYTLASSHKVSPGIKRRVAIPIAELRDRTFLYKSRTKNTCSGDSGGPGFITDGNDLFVLGITSGGDGRCEEFGESYRVDAFQSWLSTRIRN